MNKSGIKGRNNLYQPEVDGLRAIAALGVVALHFSLFPLGWAGVWLFFIISGYVITTMLIGQKWQLNTANYINFFKRRAARIWPLYFLVFGSVLMGYFALDPTKFDYIEALSFATFTGNFYAMATKDGGHALLSNLWTISVEQQFYLIFPFIFAAACRYSYVKICATVIALSMTVRAVVSFWIIHTGVDPGTATFTIYYLSPAHFDAFALGSLMAFQRQDGTGRIFGRMLQKLAVGILACVAFLAFVSPEAFESLLEQHNGSYGQLFWIYIIVDILSAALLYTAGQPTSIVNKIFSWRPLVQVGIISYGVYVLHRPIISLIATFVPHEGKSTLFRLAAFIVETLLVIGVAALSYYGFERRFHRRRVNG